MAAGIASFSFLRVGVCFPSSGKIDLRRVVCGKCMNSK